MKVSLGRGKESGEAERVSILFGNDAVFGSGLGMHWNAMDGLGLS